MTTPSPAENFGIVKNIRKLGVIIKVAHNIVPYSYVVAPPNYMRVSFIYKKTFLQFKGLGLGT